MSPPASPAPSIAHSRLAEIAAAVGQRIATELDTRSADVRSVGDELDLGIRAVERSVAGGKRLRPAFCFWGFAAVPGSGHAEPGAAPPSPAPDHPAIGAGAALELLHAAALIHDDVMDGSDTRRGGPSAHRWLQQHTGDELFGHNGAILLGDLLLTWADGVFRDAVLASGVDPAAQRRALQLFDTLRVEVTAGQFLDVFAQTGAVDDTDRAERVLQYKSAGYTVQRPLQIGAALAGADDALLAGLGAVGLPLGVAFQLRDDLLGVVGDPARTGKPVGDDLREGKRTVLLAEALLRLPAAAGAELRHGIGDPSADPGTIARLTDLVAGSGAVSAVEDRIALATRASRDALAEVAVLPEARAALAELAVLATQRSS